MTFLRLLMSNRWGQSLAAGAAILLLVFALDRCAQYAMTAMARSATEAGRQAQQASDLRETINQVEKANAAGDKVRRDGGAARDDCLRDSRTPENC